MSYWNGEHGSCNRGNPQSFIDIHVSFIYERVCRELVKGVASERLLGDRIVRMGDVGLEGGDRMSGLMATTNR
jgi:hypothetical protein